MASGRARCAAVGYRVEGVSRDKPVRFIDRGGTGALRGDDDGHDHVHHDDEYLVAKRETAHALAPHDNDSSCEHGDTRPERRQDGVRVLARANEESARAVEAPQVSLAPSSAVPPAIFVNAPAPRGGPVEASTPCYPPRRHEEQALHTSSDEPYFTPTRGLLRFERYPPTEKSRKTESAIRSAKCELDELSDKLRLHRSDPKPRITNDMHFRDLNRIENADAYYGGFTHDAVARQTQVRSVKQSASFIPPTRVSEDHAAYADAKQRSAGTETRKNTREVDTETDSLDDSNCRPPGMRASPASSRTSYRDFATQSGPVRCEGGGKWEDHRRRTRDTIPSAERRMR